MFPHSNLAVLMFVLTLHGQGEAVFGGHEAVPHSRPYMALLEMTTHYDIKKYCSGFLLNEDLVMTAAVCQAKSYKILLGVHNYFDMKGVQILTARQAFPHKEYNATTYRNNIMLLKLTSKAKFNNNVRPIALADKNNISLPTSCIVSGWGQTNRGNKVNSPLLMEVKVTLTDEEICEERNAYCSKGEDGPGMGDGGVPLVCEDGKAYGVVSAYRQFLYTYTKIPDNREWIDQIMKDVAKTCIMI